MADASALAAVAAEIARLRDAYLASLPEQLAAVSTLAAKVAGGEVDRSTLDDLHQRLHKLAGSAGTFGLDRLSKDASALEKAVKAWLGSDAIATGSVDVATRHDFLADIAALAATVGESTAAVAPTTPPPAPPTRDGTPIRLWLVEEGEALAQELGQLIRQFGYSVRLFNRVADVERAAATDRPDVLVMDVRFDEEGVDATESMLGSPSLRAMACPLLFISASGDFRTRVRAARAGAAGFLLKPVDVPRLVSRLEKLFDDRQSAPYRVMIVDDDVALSEHYRLVLTAAGMEVEALNRPESVITSIADFRPELVLMDIHMPEYSGPELATVIRHHDDWIGLPIVFLSTETDIDEQVKALGTGGDDCLTKPISDACLVAAVRARVSRSRQLTELASRDGLTGLLKHSRIKEALAVELARAERSGKPVSVAMVDVDHFKRVNDTYGHGAGDRVLRAISHLLRQRLRRTDSIGRYGGEEFAAILPDCDARTAHGVLEDIRQGFAALRFRQGNAEFSCTLSAGVAASDERSDEVLLAADAALYAAKRSGRNRICMAEKKP